VEDDEFETNDDVDVDNVDGVVLVLFFNGSIAVLVSVSVSVSVPVIDSVNISDDDFKYDDGNEDDESLPALFIELFSCMASENVFLLSRRLSVWKALMCCPCRWH